MSATYEPGTVADATVRGVPNVRVTARAHATRADRVVWMVPGDHAADEQEVTDVRPLVVLDLTEYERTHCPAFGAEVVPYLLRTLRNPGIPADAVREWLADQIEAQTRPPKPEVYEHLTAGVGDIAHALCGKVWTPNPADSVTVVGRCPECLSLAESGWIA